MCQNVWIKLTFLALVIFVLADCVSAVPPEYYFRRYMYKKKSRNARIV